MNLNYKNKVLVYLIMFIEYLPLILCIVWFVYTLCCPDIMLCDSGSINDFDGNRNLNENNNNENMNESNMSKYSLFSRIKFRISWLLDKDRNKYGSYYDYRSSSKKSLWTIIKDDFREDCEDGYRRQQESLRGDERIMMSVREDRRIRQQMKMERSNAFYAHRRKN